MSPEQAKRLGQLLREKREALQISARELSRRSNVNPATITRLEQGQAWPTPAASTLGALAEVLEIPRTDLYAAAGWVPEGELPTLQPYLRTKYHELTAEDAADVERYISELQRKHANHGPIDGEDER